MLLRNYAFMLGLCIVFCTSCSRYIFPDASKFSFEHPEVPTPQMDQYQSVQLRPGQDSSLALAVSISGGGARAANFGLGVLLGLEKVGLSKGEDLLDEVDYLSTVSGGGFAGGAYVNARYQHLRSGAATPFSLQAAWEAQIQDALAYNYAALLVRSNFSPRLWFSYVDDGDALERAIKENVLNTRRRSSEKVLVLGDMFIPPVSPRQPTLPMLFTNSAVMKSSAIFPFSPSILQAYGVTGYTHCLKECKEEDLDVYEMPVSVGIKASGSFPALISNTTLYSRYNADKPYLHLYDGAVSDNLGYRTAVNVLSQDPARKKLLFVVDADNTGGANTFSGRRGAYSSVAVLPKVASSGITSQQLLLDANLETVCAEIGAQYVRFDFTYLIKGEALTLKDRIQRKETRKALIEVLQQPNCQLSSRQKQELFYLLNDISTKYSIKPDEQELLILAGQWIVLDQAEELKVLLGR